MTASRGRVSQVAVLGAGSWGTALAMLLGRNGLRVKLWDRSAAHVESLVRLGENPFYLPGLPLGPNVEPTSDIEAAVGTATDVLVAVPSQGFRETLLKLEPILAPGIPVCWATKGFDPGTGKLLPEVAEEVLGGRPVAAISGPSFAGEVARNLPTAVTVASPSPEYAEQLAQQLHGETFRAYTSSDIKGVAVGGATKNVLAIAAGISDGLGFGSNARAALITRGLAEITRLGVMLGGVPETFSGLSGLGDLVLTCTDNQSRNRRMGLALARGLSIDDAIEEIGQAVEGVNTTREVFARAQGLGVEMPISEQTYQVLYQGLSPRDAVHALLVRDQRPETP